MVRRAFATIWPRHLGEKWHDRLVESLARDDGHLELMTLFYSTLKSKHYYRSRKYTAAAVCLELGEENENAHVHMYVEHNQKRMTTLGKDFGILHTAFQTVRDSTGSYNYVTGSGTHADKPAIDRWQFGEFKLHGDSQKADLRLLINHALSGMSKYDLFHNYPYAWCVHRDRMTKFYDDMKVYKKRKPLPPIEKNLVGFGEEKEKGASILRAPPDTDTIGE